MKTRLLLALAVVVAAVDLSRSPRRSMSSREGEQALVVRLGAPVGVVVEPGLKVKAPFIDSVYVYDTRLLLLEPPPEQMILGDQKRLEVQPYTRFRIVDPLRFYQALRTLDQARAQLSQIVSSSVRRELGQAPLLTLLTPAARRHRRRDQERGRGQGAAARRRNRRSALPSRRPAVRDQPGDLRPHEVGAPARGQGAARARRRVGAADPVARRPRPHRPALGGAARRHDQPRRGRRGGQPRARRGVRQGSELLPVLSRAADLPQRARRFRPDAGALARRRFPADAGDGPKPPQARRRRARRRGARRERARRARRSAEPPGPEAWTSRREPPGSSFRCRSSSSTCCSAPTTRC